MTLAIAIVLAVLVIAFALFVTGALPPDLIALSVLAVLVAAGVVSPAEAFSGFSSFAVVTIAGLMVIGDGLERTGVVKSVARSLEKVIHERYRRLLLLNTGIPGVLSGFVNIVAAASFFVPVILRLCKQLRVPQSKILLPMACTALIGANLTLIGASHNLVVDSLLTQETGRGFGFFEFSAVGLALLLAALAYIATIGQRLLPGERSAPDPAEVPVTTNLIDVYHLEDRVFEVWVSDDLVTHELRIRDLDLGAYGLTLLAVVRESEQLLLPEGDLRLWESDMLLIQGREPVVARVAESHEALTFIGPPQAQERYPISTAELAECVVPPRSAAVGRRVRDLDLPEQFGMTVIAYYRGHAPHRTDVHNLVLQEGDSLLLYGPRERMREFDPEKELLIYFKPGEPEVSRSMKRRAPLAAAILGAVIAGAAAGWLPIAATAVLGALAMVLTGIVRLGRLYQAIDGRTLVLIAGMYPLGIALDNTGAADLIGTTLIEVLGGFGPLAVMAGVTVLCMVLTQPIHNAAVAIIMTPVAINAASMMDANPRAFCVAVIVACSAAFFMPYGHPAPFLVQKPGGYAASDYVRFGAGLGVITLAVILGLVPVLFPL